MFMLLRIPLPLNMLLHSYLMLLSAPCYLLQILHSSSPHYSYFMPYHLLITPLHINSNFHPLMMLYLPSHLHLYFLLPMDLMLLYYIHYFHSPHSYSIYIGYSGSPLIHLTHHLLLLLRYDYSLMLSYSY